MMREEWSHGWWAGRDGLRHAGKMGGRGDGGMGGAKKG
jgi:hypothetical protein